MMIREMDVREQWIGTVSQELFGKTVRFGGWRQGIRYNAGEKEQ